MRVALGVRTGAGCALATGDAAPGIREGAEGAVRFTENGDGARLTVLGIAGRATADGAEGDAGFRADGAGALLTVFTGTADGMDLGEDGGAEIR
jgi:hypothetical protein